MNEAPLERWIAHHKRGLSPLHHDKEPPQPADGKPIKYVRYVRADTVVDREGVETLISFLRDDLCDLAEALPAVPAPSCHPLEAQRLALIAAYEKETANEG